MADSELSRRDQPPSRTDAPNGFGEWLPLVLVLLLAALLRGVTLGQASLWVDELAQVLTYYSDSYKVVMYQAAKHGQPPLDYWIGYVIFKFCRSDVAARLPAMCFGIATVAASYLLARRLVSRGYALLVAVALACSPFAIHYSQEARPYALCWCALVVAIWLLHRAWQRNRCRDWLWFTAAWMACQMSRSLGPLTISAGLGLYGVWAVYRRMRHADGRSTTAFLRLRGVRLLLCLAVVWGPFLYLFQFILHQTRKGSYLVEDTTQLLNWADNLAVVRLGLEALWHCTMPLGWIVVPLGLFGAWGCVRRTPAPHGTRRGLVFAPVLIGYGLHVAVYALVVGGTLPKLAYWGYMLSFLYVGAVWSLAEGVKRWPRMLRSPGALRASWCAAAGLLVLLSLRVDPQVAIVRKPDWRGALAALDHQIDPASDVVFCAEAQPYGTGGMVFRVSPHYWRTADHLVNVLRDHERLFNDGRPVLDRRNCRVALLVKCHPHWDGPALDRRLTPAARAAFELQTFQHFFTLTSRERFLTADDGLIAVAGVVEQLLAGQPELGAYLRIGLMRVLSKRGRLAEAAEVYAAARAAVAPATLAGFERLCQDYDAYVASRRPPAAHLTAWPAP